MPRGLILLLGAAGIFVTLFGINAFQDIVGPTFLALMLVVAVLPIQSRLVATGWPKWLATVVLVVSAYAILIALALALAYAAARFASLIPTYADDADELTAQVHDWLNSIGIDQAQVDSATSSFQLSDLTGFLTDLLSSLAGAVGNIVFVCAVIIFLGMDSLGFSARLAHTSGSRPDVVGAMTGFAHGTRKYLVVSTIFGAIVAVIDTAALWMLGIPLPLLWGIVSFVTNYIPNIGFIIGVIPPAILGLLEGGFPLMLAVIAVYSVINFVIQSIIQPKFVGDSVGLSTTVTFLSMAIWTWAIGPLGALLAIPLTLLTKAVLLDIDPATRWIGDLIGSGHPDPEDERPPPGGPQPVAQAEG
jgi:predicted PurR-regulated permease PerM